MAARIANSLMINRWRLIFEHGHNSDRQFPDLSGALGHFLRFPLMALSSPGLWLSQIPAELRLACGGGLSVNFPHLSATEPLQHLRNNRARSSLPGRFAGLVSFVRSTPIILPGADASLCVAVVTDVFSILLPSLN